MSRTPNSRKEETHERIVDVAARAIRRHGYAGVGVADVMKEAGLTHGGFYAHLASLETGCPVAALGCDMPRQSQTVREASSMRVQRLIAAVRATLPEAPRA